MKTGSIIGITLGALVGVYLLYLIVEKVRQGGTYGADFYGYIVGLLAVVIMPIAFAMKGRPGMRTRSQGLGLW